MYIITTIRGHELFKKTVVISFLLYKDYYIISIIIKKECGLSVNYSNMRENFCHPD